MSDDMTYPVHESQDNSLRYQRWSVQRHDDIWVGMRKEIAKLSRVLRVENTEVDIVPLLRLDRRGAFRLRRLRDSRRVRGLRSSDIEPGLLLLLYSGSTWWLLLRDGGRCSLVGVGRIGRRSLRHRRQGLTRNRTSAW